MWASSFVFNQFFGWNILPISCKGQALSHSQVYISMDAFFFTTFHVPKYSNFPSSHTKVIMDSECYYICFSANVFLLLLLSLKAVIIVDICCLFTILYTFTAITEQQGKNSHVKRWVRFRYWHLLSNETLFLIDTHCLLWQQKRISRRCYLFTWIYDSLQFAQFAHRTNHIKAFPNGKPVSLFFFLSLSPFFVAWKKNLLVNWNAEEKKNHQRFDQFILKKVYVIAFNSVQNISISLCRNARQKNVECDFFLFSMKASQRVWRKKKLTRKFQLFCSIGRHLLHFFSSSLSKLIDGEHRCYQ